MKPPNIHIIHWPHSQLILTLGVCPRTLPARAREPCTLPPFRGMVRSTARFSSEPRHTSSCNKQKGVKGWKERKENFIGYPNSKHKIIVLQNKITNGYFSEKEKSMLMEFITVSEVSEVKTGKRCCCFG
jgi:hypothetical protein